MSSSPSSASPRPARWTLTAGLAADGAAAEPETEARAPTPAPRERVVSSGEPPQDCVASTYDSALWSRILDEQADDAMALGVDDACDICDARQGGGVLGGGAADLPALLTRDGQAAEDAPGVGSAPHGYEELYGQLQAPFRDDTPVKTDPSTPFDQWEQPYDADLGLASSTLSELGAALALPQGDDATSAATASCPSPPTSAALMCLPSSNLLPVYEGFAASADSPIELGVPMAQQPGHVPFTPGAPFWQRPHVLSFGAQPNGLPFPLSKPLLRDDGVLLVGTEDTASGASTNRIFMTNFLDAASPLAPTTSHIAVEQEVRDLQWLSASVAVAAMGNELQLVLVGDGGATYRLLDPIPTIHGDAIRELAVQTSSCSVLSGGFDHTVVLSDLHDQRNPETASLVSKYDARDVVSSLRWSLSESEFSWTTDGGELRLLDTRARSSSVELRLLTEYMHEFGGLFTHEYLDNSHVALGFERGQVAFVDTRMPRSDPYAVICSLLPTVGEIRRARPHQTNKVALFGYGGFATAQASVNQSRQLILDHFSSRQEHQIGIKQYKTSGDFSFENGDYLAVTDNLGTVSLYNTAYSRSEESQETQGSAWRL